MNGTVNRVILIGNLGDDPKVITFDDQNKLARFPLATSESYIKKETNEKVETTEWHNIVMRNRQAEIAEQYLSKGDKLFVEGKLKYRKWEENGQDRYITEIIVDNFTFLTPKKSNEQPSAANEVEPPF